jgi:dolichol kinase
MVTAELKSEIKRKAFHAGINGTLGPLVILGISNPQLARAVGLTIYGVFLTLFLLLEYSMRKGKNWNVPFASKTYDIIKNDYEIQSRTMHSAVLLVVSGMLIIAFLDLRATLVGIMVMSYADPAASITGKAYPNHSLFYNKKKHYEGTLAFMGVSFLVTALVLSLVPMALSQVLAVSAVIAVVTGVFESLPMVYYFDNFTVPIVAGLLAQFFISLV